MPTSRSSGEATGPIFCRQGIESTSPGKSDKFSVLVRLMIFLGIVSAATGIWECTQGIDQFHLEGASVRYKIPGKMLLFTGSLLTVMSLVTIIEATRAMRMAIFSLLQGLTIVLIIESVAGSTAYAMSSFVSNGFFNRSLLLDLEKEYSKDWRASFAWDEIQTTFSCCGVGGPQDWRNSYWYTTKIQDGAEYPYSCCDEGFHCNATTVNDKGCGADASTSLYDSLSRAYWCAFSSVFIHILIYLVVATLERKE